MSFRCGFVVSSAFFWYLFADFVHIRCLVVPVFLLLDCSSLSVASFSSSLRSLEVAVPPRSLSPLMVFVVDVCWLAFRLVL